MKRIEWFLFSLTIIILLISSNVENSPASDYISDLEIATTSIVSNNTEPEPEPEKKLYLLGFGLFRRPIRRLISFKVYFKRIGIIIMGDFLTFTIIIEYSRRLRLLESREEPATCYKIHDVNESIHYNCSATVDENRNFTTIKSKGDYYTNGSKLSFEETTMSFDANIAEMTDDSLEHSWVDLWDGERSHDESTFTINGQILNESFSESNIKLTLNDTDDKKTFPCEVSHYQEYYKLVCTPKERINNANMNNSIGIGTDKNVLVHMKPGHENLQFSPDGNPISNYHRKGSSRKLSGGAIAAIIICCIFVLIAVIVTAYLLKKRKPVPKFPRQESAFEFYSSTAKFN